MGGKTPIYIIWNQIGKNGNSGFPTAKKKGKGFLSCCGPYNF